MRQFSVLTKNLLNRIPDLTEEILSAYRKTIFSEGTIHKLSLWGIIKRKYKISQNSVLSKISVRLKMLGVSKKLVTQSLF